MATPPNDCTICMDPAPSAVERKYLECKHWYHVICIDSWLADHNTCPTCRAVIKSLPKPVYESFDSEDGYEECVYYYSDEEGSDGEGEVGDDEDEEDEEGRYNDPLGERGEDDVYDEEEEEDEESECEDYSESVWNNTSEFRQDAQITHPSSINALPTCRSVSPSLDSDSESDSEAWTPFRRDVEKMRCEMEHMLPSDANAGEDEANDDGVLALIMGMENLSLCDRMIWEGIE